MFSAADPRNLPVVSDEDEMEALVGGVPAVPFPDARNIAQEADPETVATPDDGPDVEPDVTDDAHDFSDIDNDLLTLLDDADVEDPDDVDIEDEGDDE